MNILTKHQPTINVFVKFVTNLVEIKNAILEVNLQRFTDFLLAGADFQSSKNLKLIPLSDNALVIDHPS